MISVQGLSKRYARTVAVDNISFEVQKGQIVGFLGPNGAGKTTMIRVLVGLLRPTAGSARIAGFDCWSEAVEVHRLTGYLPGEFALDPTLTGAQILQYLANLHGGVDQRYLASLV
ncbi:MAG TPA: ATP-binding cassette domain-containing protein, partial [Bryobacteraceae bacterium]|nr:ATP-binding cassette domain-containing protein [Bryobacteraceae bacterium]